ncbi:hypothetical protein Cgig2_027659 [Carnegiea gigantea]|uniref:Uncharacterized protein n=1 Tax=Carnegiea gigantea TaxID=171969 RepID=A0A9Q1GM76_9CARY|nr:hypothetical protein Cgig2_027659 [Carnegiea gigantea]
MADALHSHCPSHGRLAKSTTTSTLFAMHSRRAAGVRSKSSPRGQVSERRRTPERHSNRKHKAKARTLEVDFLVIDVPTSYNVILRRRTLHKRRSTDTSGGLKSQKGGQQRVILRYWASGSLSWSLPSATPVSLPSSPGVMAAPSRGTVSSSSRPSSLVAGRINSTTQGPGPRPWPYRDPIHTGCTLQSSLLRGRPGVLKSPRAPKRNQHSPRPWTSTLAASPLQPPPWSGLPPADAAGFPSRPPSPSSASSSSACTQPLPLHTFGALPRDHRFAPRQMTSTSLPLAPEHRPGKHSNTVI